MFDKQRVSSFASLTRMLFSRWLVDPSNASEGIVVSLAWNGLFDCGLDASRDRGFAPMESNAWTALFSISRDLQLMQYRDSATMDLALVAMLRFITRLPEYHGQEMSVEECQKQCEALPLLSSDLVSWSSLCPLICEQERGHSSEFAEMCSLLGFCAMPQGECIESWCKPEERGGGYSVALDTDKLACEALEVDVLASYLFKWFCSFNFADCWFD